MISSSNISNALKMHLYTHFICSPRTHVGGSADCAHAPMSATRHKLNFSKSEWNNQKQWSFSGSCIILVPRQFLTFQQTHIKLFPQVIISRAINHMLREWHQRELCLCTHVRFPQRDGERKWIIVILLWFEKWWVTYVTLLWHDSLPVCESI